MLHILVSLCGLISCVSQHKHLLVYLSCHSITKTKQGPFTRPAPARSFSPAARRQPRGSARRCSPPSGPTCHRVALLAPRGLAPTVVSRAELQSQIKPINFATKRKESKNNGRMTAYIACLDRFRYEAGDLTGGAELQDLLHGSKRSPRALRQRLAAAAASG